jgi:hypothetical protein
MLEQFGRFENISSMRIQDLGTAGFEQALASVLKARGNPRDQHPGCLYETPYLQTQAEPVLVPAEMGSNFS